MNRKQILSIISLLFIAVAYFLSRFVYFEYLKLKELIDIIILVSSALTCLFILSENDILSIFSSCGSLVSFLLAIVINKASLDVTWLIIYFLIIVLGLIINKVFRK